MLVHANEIPIDDLLVKRLVAEQFPEWAGLPLEPPGQSGSSNRLYRLGTDYLVRLPRQPGGGDTIVKEHQWQRVLQDHLDIRIPEIIALGQPSLIFPETWSVQRWIPGTRLNAGSPANAALTQDLARAIRQLRAIPLPDVVRETLRPYRGQSLKQHDRQFHRNVDGCRNIDGLDLDLDRILTIWEHALDQPDAVGNTWFHSDLVAENLLVDEAGRLTAILDFGGLGIGDPAIDLHGAWEIFTRVDRKAFRDAVGVSEAEWLRARAWALAVPLMTFTYYWRSMPGRIHDRMTMIQAVLEED